MNDVIKSLEKSDTSCIPFLLEARETLKEAKKFNDVRKINLALRYIFETKYKEAIKILKDFIPKKVKTLREKEVV